MKDFNLENIVRPNIWSLKPYSSARDEFTGKEGIFLDANENPYGTLNRYPDPYQRQLKDKLSAIKNVSPENIFIGNGSDEVIDLAFRIFCEPDKDLALTFSPTYGMYDVSAAINNIGLIKLPLSKDFQIDLQVTRRFIDQENLKLVFLCSPNNPTGNTMSREAIEMILENFSGILIIDEAYIDFSSHASTIELIQKYPNLIVSQTFSKAWGLAAARVGIAYAHPQIIQLYNKVKPPYNVSTLNQRAALEALNAPEKFEKKKSIILKEKENLKADLQRCSLVKKIYPSDANFLLVEVGDADKIYNALVQQKVITRNRTKQVRNCLRFTVGTPEENNQLLQALKKMDHE
jgi:histidinol-phosphate aminotransferase